MNNELHEIYGLLMHLTLMFAAGSLFLFVACFLSGQTAALPLLSIIFTSCTFSGLMVAYLDLKRKGVNVPRKTQQKSSEKLSDDVRTSAQDDIKGSKTKQKRDVK